MKIGSIITAECQKQLGIKPDISIDVPTRLSLRIDATEAQFNQVLAALPGGTDQWELLKTPTVINGKLKVELRPIPAVIRDLGAEIDTIKTRITALESKGPVTI